MAVFVPFLYLLGPLYFFYVKYSIIQNTKLVRLDFLHLLPFVICFLVILPFYLKSGTEKLELYHAPSIDHFQLEPNRIFFYGLIFLSAFYYCFKSLKLIKGYSKNIDGRKNEGIKSKIKWLRYYTKGFLFCLFIFLIAQLIIIFTDFHRYYVMLTTVSVFSILIHIVSYWSIKESTIVKKKTNKKISVIQSKEIYLNFKDKVVSLFENDKIHLNSDLNSKFFCEKLIINSQYFSKLINQEFKCNLSYLINSYRVESAKELLGIMNMVI